MSWPKRLWHAVVSLGLAVLLGWGAWWALMDPLSPLPPEWHPFTPLDVEAPVTWLTKSKLRAAVQNEAACLAALQPVARVESMAPKVEGPQCGIDPRVVLRGVGLAQMRGVETTCAIALRLAMWEQHVVQPAARNFLGQEVAELQHQGSYNCRPIRSTRGVSKRMSTHATAEAIDLRGVVLTNGRKVALLGNYVGSSPEALFYRELRDGACGWFKTVLGPEFNALHADHFHMQSVGRGACR